VPVVDGDDHVVPGGAEFLGGVGDDGAGCGVPGRGQVPDGDYVESDLSRRRARSGLELGGSLPASPLIAHCPPPTAGTSLGLDDRG
jgi:hypothetical protein